MATDYIAKAITKAFGERCPEYAAGCYCCEAWKQRDSELNAMTDMREGWRYIRTKHGDLSGVGWDRAEQAVDAALTRAREALS